MFLTPEEMAELTGRKVRECQRLALNQMGISYKIRPDGSLAVLRSHIVDLLGGDCSNDKFISIEPNWSAIE